VESLAKHEKILLLQLARRALIRRVAGNSLELEALEHEFLMKPSGAFVTLHLDEELRGCIGRIRSEEPLGKVIQEMAMAAATQDHRFEEVRPEEVSQLDIEISVMTPPKQIQSVEEIEVGIHGLIVSDMGRTGLLLPQVPTQYGWGRETFLSYTCQKAGLPMNYWLEKKPKIETFSALVFSEKGLGADHL